MKLSVFYSTNASEKRNNFISDHIHDTIGLYYKDYEIIELENHNALFSLTHAYNMGLRLSLSDYVVFIHNDIEFLENGWGRKIVNYLDKYEYGILGIAGTTDLSDGKWWESQKDMIGSVKHQRGAAKWWTNYSPPHKEPSDAVVVDGLFIAVNKQRIKHEFDDKLFDGFHFYDIDFCLANFLEDVKVGVVHDIPVIHYSIGQTNSEWDTKKFFIEQKYNGKFPLTVTPKIKYSEAPINLKIKDKVSVIIPSYLDEKSLVLVEQCLESFHNKVKYKNYEIILGINHPEIASKKQLVNKFESLVHKYANLKVVQYDYYNFAKLNNDMIFNHISSDSEYILFCNNDIELLNDVISNMLNSYENEETIGNFYGTKFKLGTIGARLHYPEDGDGKGRIQHAGVFCIKHQRFDVGHIGYKTYYNYHSHNVFANTAALMMVRKKDFLDVGGLNTEYNECFEDVEFNLELLLRNKLNYVNTDAVAIHKESITRGINIEAINKDSKILLPKISNSYERHKLIQFFVKNIQQ